MRTVHLLTVCILGLIATACVATATPTADAHPTPTAEVPTLAITPPAATKRPAPTISPTMSLLEAPTATLANIPKLTATSEISPEYMWKCWNPNRVSPCQPLFPFGMKAITFVSENNGWVVGEGGYIAHWDGISWSQVESPTEATINAVAFITPDDGWAVGDGAQILHWDGNTWVVVMPYLPSSEGPSSESYFLNGIAFVNADDGWAVGGISTEMGCVARILRWDGKNWREVYANYCDCALTAISVIAADNIWAVGGGSRGITLHWNGDQWEQVTNPTQSWLYSVSANASDDVWAVGEDIVLNSPLTRGVILHWNGLEWSEIRLPFQSFLNQLYFVAAFSKDNVVFDGYSHLHWNGKRWTQIAFNTSLNSQNDLLDAVVSIAVDSKHQTWAVTRGGRLLQLISLLPTETTSPVP